MEVQKKARMCCADRFAIENYGKKCSQIKSIEEDSDLGVNC